MKLVVCCKKCYKINRIAIKATDRVDLSMKLGNNFSHKCNACKVVNNFEVNDVEAKESVALGVVFLLILMLVVLVLIFFLKILILYTSSYKLVTLLLLIPVLFGLAYIREEKKYIRIFNSYRL